MKKEIIAVFLFYFLVLFCYYKLYNGYIMVIYSILKSIIFRTKYMFKTNDIIDYGFYTNIKVVGENKYHYILEDKYGSKHMIYKDLVNKYGKKMA